MSKQVIFRDLSIVTILFIIVILTNSMISTHRTSANEARKTFVVDLGKLEESARQFEKAIESNNKSVKLYKDLRKSYKKVEFLVTYLDPRFVNASINGAPLPKLPSVDGPSFEIIDPKGLQVLDELMYNDSDIEIELIKEAKLFTKNVKKLCQVCEQYKLQDRYIFESLRMSITRLTTMGITGFDTPSSLLGLEDAIITLNQTNDYLTFYKNKNTDRVNSLQKRISIAVHYIGINKNFNTFDRFEFIKNHLNPINTELLNLQLSLNIETTDEVMTDAQPTNPLSKNVFESDFLNKDYYAGQYTNSKEYRKRVELGKLLFFDPVLSLNNERACASCHNPTKAFTDGQKKSIAFDFKGTVDRNSQSIINAIYADKFFWDLRSKRLADQVEHVVLNEKEFNTDFLSLINKLKGSKEYVTLFNQAYPTILKGISINKSTISESLVAYISSLNGFNSKFDKNIRGEENSMSIAEKNGFNLFMGKAACATCHFAPTFSGLVPPFFTESESEVLGVTSVFDTLHPTLDKDLGRYGANILKETADFYQNSFKTVSVRNVGLTTPYMHNGAFETLDEVLAFYNKGGGAGMGLDLPQQTLSPDPLGLSKLELSELKAFMLTLTDTTHTTIRPSSLPKFGNELDYRVIGGKY